MTYQQTIDYLFAKLPMFSRIGVAAYKKDLTNITALCEALGNPQQQFKSIHIAGTNGKGSVSHMLAAVLQTAGYKTGLYTSPHLKDFRERIRINGEMIAKEFVTDFTEQIKPLIEKIEPSFFEITVAMAFEYFARQKTEVAVIEVGLGGRLDSTNIIIPELSVITNIGWDHMNILGDTLESIAFEKAGIIKKNVPVVIGEVIPETKPVFEKKAKEEYAAISFAQEKFSVIAANYHDHELSVEVEDKMQGRRHTYYPDLPGFYQTHNLVTALEALRVLQQNEWKITGAHVSAALKKVKKLTGLHGRWEVVHRSPDIVLDVGHNEDGIRQIVLQLRSLNYPKIHIVLGMVKDKEVQKTLSLLPKDAVYYFTRAQIPRALPEHLLAEKALQAGLNGAAYANVNDALQAAVNNAGMKDLILVCGSVFVAGEAEINKIQFKAGTPDKL